MKINRRLAYILLAFAFIFVLTRFLQSQEKKSIPALWTIDDVINQERATDFNLSPDGQMVAWVKTCLIKRKIAAFHIFF